ncbi:hypothetical protein B7P43_G07952 [Cryptotermes secundus]|uniref:Uncharacterized protein n=1 Tax=Cryptotermes secundus TaxID=105785 RepID=A0A2J7QTE8_9NEOP|nr:hypothetical protein B7P43_G07952 [Cryptotermes secundus]
MKQPIGIIRNESASSETPEHKVYGIFHRSSYAHSKQSPLVSRYESLNPRSGRKGKLSLCLSN